MCEATHFPRETLIDFRTLLYIEASDTPTPTLSPKAPKGFCVVIVRVGWGAVNIKGPSLYFNVFEYIIYVDTI